MSIWRGAARDKSSADSWHRVDERFRHSNIRQPHEPNGDETLSAHLALSEARPGHREAATEGPSPGRAIAL
jgi:hypothetical protein